MSSLEVKELAPEDVEATVSLWQACGLTRPWNNPREDIEFAMASENATILAGWLNERLAASVMVGHDGHRGTVYYVAVHPDEQGKGFGREIMAAAEDWLRARGMWKLNLIVRAENRAVIDFYSSLGYAVEERVNMARWLDPDKAPS